MIEITVEPYMIKKPSPILNVNYNLSPGSDTTPKSKKEIEREKYLDKMYREIFDKKLYPLPLFARHDKMN